MIKTVTLPSGEVISLSSGDTVFVTLKPNETNTLVRGTFVGLPSTGEGILFSVLSPKLEVQQIIISESRIVKVEKPN